MKNNPYNLTFGKEPAEMIERYAQSGEIMDSFTSERPPQQVYMITGVRGIGKTVFMTTIAGEFSKKKDWLVVELNSSGEILKELAAKLYNARGLARIFDAAGIDLSFWGIGIKIRKSEPLTDLSTAVERMLERLDKEHKRVLITIDEVSNTGEMQLFAGAFQIFVRHDLPVFLLMTGLYENINRLQNEENLTFLYRAPKIRLSALNITRMSASYERLLHLPQDQARKLAELTRGYSFAFQVFGYFTFRQNGDMEAALPEARQYLDEYVYDKIWTELSPRELELVSHIALHDHKEVSRLKADLNLAGNQFSVYRDRLIKKGILDGSRRGLVTFSLPFFEDYVREHTEEV